MVNPSENGRPGQFKGNIIGSEEWFSAIFDGSRDAIFLTNVYGCFVEVNISAEILTGYTKQELLKMSIPDLHDVADLGAYNDFFDKILAGEDIMSESVIRRKDGTYVNTEFSNRRIIVGKDYFMHTIARDITERKHTNQKLLESEKRYRSLVELAHTGIAIHQDGVFVYVNRAGLKILGCTNQEQILGKPVISIVHPESRKKVIKRMELVASGIPVPPLEEKLIRLDGTFFDAEVSSIPTTFKDNPAGQVIVIDITDRKKAQDELKAKEEKYRTIFDSTGTITLIIEENAEIVMANRECYALSGYSPAELVGQKWTRFVSPESLDTMLKNHKLRREGSNLAPKKYQVNLIHRNGGIRNVILDIAMIPGSKQSVVSMLDITDQTIAVAKLRESDTKYRLLSEQTGVGIGIYSPEGKILFFNEKALQNLDGKSEDFIGRTLVEAFGKKAGREFTNRVKKVIKTGKNFDSEDYVNTSKGTHWFLSNHTRIVDSNGDVVGVQIVSHDITELKRIESALKQSSSYNRSLIEASLDPMVTIGPDGKIMDVNKATQDVTGYSRQKLIGTDFSAYFTNPAKAQAGYEEVFSKGFVRDYLLEIKNRKGELIPVLYNATLYRDEEGKVTGVFAAARDISELKKAEEKLEKTANELRELSRHIEDLMETEKTQIAHDLHDDLGQKLTALNMDISWL